MAAQNLLHKGGRVHRTSKMEFNLGKQAEMLGGKTPERVVAASEGYEKATMHNVAERVMKQNAEDRARVSAKHEKNAKHGGM